MDRLFMKKKTCLKVDEFDEKTMMIEGRLKAEEKKYRNRIDPDSTNMREEGNIFIWCIERNLRSIKNLIAGYSELFLLIEGVLMNSTKSRIESRN